MASTFNYGYHNQVYIFIDIFHTGHFSAVKFVMGYEKNMSFLVLPKSPKVRRKKKKVALGLLLL